MNMKIIFKVFSSFLFPLLFFFSPFSFIAGCASEGETVNDIGEIKIPDGMETTDIADGDIQPETRPDGECLTYEECNGIDDDCDGEIDEDFDLSSDPSNCGWCGFACVTPNGKPGCSNSMCIIESCNEGHYDIDGNPYNGCEYECTKTADSESNAEGNCNDGIDNDCNGRIDNDDPNCNECVPEFCNTEDDDCDTLVDEDFDLRSDPLNCGQCHNVCPNRPNADGICVLGECLLQCHAGYSDLNNNPLDGCEAPCVPSENPSESECNGIDNDCDGQIDEDYTPYTCGQGACETHSVCVRGEETCIPLTPLSPNDTLCDGIDNDCDGQIDEEFAPVTCLGVCRNGARCSGGVEICGPKAEEQDTTCDGIDGDCDRDIDEDYVPYVCGTGACENQSVCSGGVESCTPLPPRSTEDLICDGIDEDCDGNIDEDYRPHQCGIGACTANSTCNNGIEECHPSPPPFPDDSRCNGIDDDCDGRTDEDYVPHTCGQGACTRTSTCSGGIESCIPGTPSPSDRNCDGIDEDCDGYTDEDYIPYTCGVGVCQRNSTCSGGRESCTPGSPTRVDDTCNGIDEDCDGSIDEHYIPYTCGQGVCQRTSTCIGGVQSCSPGSPTGSDNNCNGLDEDCDGATDEHYVPYTCGVGACQRNSTCVGGVPSCTPGSPSTEICNYIDDDCDGTVDEITQTDPNNCGSCGHVCSLPNATAGCSGGTCVVVSCNSGYSNCDSNHNNGCEVNHNNNPPSTSPTYIGQICGDETSTGPTQNQRTEMWYWIKVEECDTIGWPSLNFYVRLTPPSGTDYDLYVYNATSSGSCGSLVASSANAGSTPDIVHIGPWGDNWGSDDERFFCIEVRWFSGASCSNWSLETRSYSF